MGFAIRPEPYSPRGFGRKKPTSVLLPQMPHSANCTKGAPNPIVTRLSAIMPLARFFGALPGFCRKLPENTPFAAFALI